jgi:hypothetical protein
MRSVNRRERAFVRSRRHAQGSPAWPDQHSEAAGGGAANLGLLMRNIFGVGTPRGQQSRVQAAFSIITAVKRVLRPHRRPSMREYGWFLRRFLPHALTLRVPVPA